MKYSERRLPLPELFNKEQPHADGMVAWHEAGHVLLDCLGGLVPGVATIMPNKGSAGYVSSVVNYFSVLPVDQVKEMNLSIHLAGLVAAAYHTGWYNWEGAVHDIEYAEAAIVFYSLQPADVLKIWMQLHQTIEQHSDTLQEIAGRLTAEKFLTPEYFEELIFRI